MSEGRDYDGQNSNGDDKAICRDYLRNVCRRGKNCKYTHPDNAEAEKLGLKQKTYVFCHDYQNKECRRTNCKFIHCNRDEEEFYKATGELPSQLKSHMDGPSSGGDSLASDGEIPVCRDYLKGDCRRGVKCKFRHMSQGDYDYHMRSRQREPQRSRFDDPYDRRDFDDYEFERVRKRARSDLDYELQRDYLRPRSLDYRDLEEEVIMLRRKVDDLKKQVAGLTATNDVLLDQNARLRAAKLRGSPTPDSTRVRNVTSYNQMIPTSHQVPQMPNSTITITSVPGLSQDDLSARQQTSVLTAEQQQLIAQEIQPLVSLTQGITPATCITSIAPAITPASITTQTIQPQIPLSGQSSQMVSYPIVSQNMRTLPQSNLAQ
ncbi:zinc finger CCCH domain-containing protein 10-like [Glandiceps talaboti]